MNKKKVGRILLLVLIIVTVLFIFSHSIVGKSTSIHQSSTVRAFLQNIFNAMGIPWQLTTHVVRKLAHFAEFFVLGLELTWYHLCGHKLGRRDIGSIAITVFAVGFADETIQIFSARGPGIADVWLDIAGGMTGMLFVFALYYLVNVCRRKGGFR